jgi:hypothetical protein
MARRVIPGVFAASFRAVANKTSLAPAGPARVAQRHKVVDLETGERLREITPNDLLAALSPAVARALMALPAHLRAALLALPMRAKLKLIDLEPALQLRIIAMLAQYGQALTPWRGGAAPVGERAVVATGHAWTHATSSTGMPPDLVAFLMGGGRAPSWLSGVRIQIPRAGAGPAPLMIMGAPVLPPTVLLFRPPALPVVRVPKLGEDLAQQALRRELARRAAVQAGRRVRRDARRVPFQPLIDRLEATILAAQAAILQSHGLLRLLPCLDPADVALVQNWNLAALAPLTPALQLNFVHWLLDLRTCQGWLPGLARTLDRCRRNPELARAYLGFLSPDVRIVHQRLDGFDLCSTAIAQICNTAQPLVTACSPYLNWGADPIVSFCCRKSLGLTVEVVKAFNELLAFSNPTRLAPKAIFDDLLSEVAANHRAIVIKAFVAAKHQPKVRHLCALIANWDELDDHDNVPVAVLISLIKCGMIIVNISGVYDTNSGKGRTLTFLLADNGGRLTPELHMHFQTGRIVRAAHCGWKRRGEKFQTDDRPSCSNNNAEAIIAVLEALGWTVRPARW